MAMNKIQRTGKCSKCGARLFIPFHDNAIEHQHYKPSIYGDVFNKGLRPTCIATLDDIIVDITLTGREWEALAKFVGDWDAFNERTGFPLSESEKVWLPVLRKIVEGK